MSGAGLHVDPTRIGSIESILTYPTKRTYIPRLAYNAFDRIGIESIAHPVNGGTQFTTGADLNVTVSKTFDYICRPEFQITLPELKITISKAAVTGSAAGVPDTDTFLGGWCECIGEAIIDTIVLTLGKNNASDTLTGESIHIKAQCRPDSEKQAYYEMIGHVPSMNSKPSVYVAGTGGAANTHTITIPSRTITLPIPVWFQNVSNALQIFDVSDLVRFKIKLQSLSNLWYVKKYTYAGTSNVLSTVTNITSVADGNGYSAAATLTNSAQYVFWMDHVSVTENCRTVMRQLNVHPQMKFMLCETLVSAASTSEAFSYTTPECKVILTAVNNITNLFWVMQRASVKNVNEHFNYSSQPYVFMPFLRHTSPSDDNALAANLLSGGSNAGYLAFDALMDKSTGTGLFSHVPCAASSMIRLGTSPRFEERDAQYFTRGLFRRLFKATPSMGLNFYTFSAVPDISEHQPSGMLSIDAMGSPNNNFIIVKPNTAAIGSGDVYVRYYAFGYKLLVCTTACADDKIDASRPCNFQYTFVDKM